jgi:hypothetical protein
MKHQNWQCLPGSYDEFHLEEWNFKSRNPSGIPDLLPQDFDLPENALFSGYRFKRPERINAQQDVCHGFLEDYKLSSLFGSPNKSLNHAKRYFAICTPNFPLSDEYPDVINVFNVFRSRWLGRFWQEHGMRVIPTVNWAGFSSYLTSFAGISQGQILALTIPDEIETTQDINIKLFRDGYYEMEQLLKPRLILVRGDLKLVHVTPSTPIITISKWQKSRSKRNEQGASVNL